MAKFKQDGKGKGGSGRIMKKGDKNKKTPEKFKAKAAGKKKFTHKKKKNFSGTKKLKENLQNQGEVNQNKDDGKEKIDEKSNKRKLPTDLDDKNSSKKLKSKGPPEDDVNRLMMAIYEKLRRKNVSKEDKHKLIDEVISHVRDKEKQVIFKHGTVRVLEHCIKCGSNEQRQSLFELFKVKEESVLLVTSAGYSQFFVKKFMEYGSKEQKAKIISSFHGKVRKLIKQKVAAEILDDIYVKYANAHQRNVLTEEFYGPEFTVFNVATGQSFEDLMEKEPKKKDSILNYMKTQFLALCEKDTIFYSITHKALLQFFKYADDGQKREVFDALKEKVIHILHTKDGAKVAMHCLWLATTKDRKSILKSFKTFVVKICKEEFGHLAMLALLDVVDDTVLVKKAIFSEILLNLEDLIADQYGRKVILYLLKPRSHSYFLPDIVKLLEQGDNNPHSKKIPAVRQEELRSSILPDLLKTMTPHVKDIMKNKSVAIVLLAAVDCSEDLPELSSLFEEIANVISKPLTIEEPEENEDVDQDTNKDGVDEEVNHLILDACGHWVIKNIVQKDLVRLKDDREVIFSQILCNTMPAGSFADWAAVNRGAFVLISLLETKIDSVKNRVLEDLKLLSTSLSIDKGKGIELLSKLIDQ